MKDKISEIHADMQNKLDNASERWLEGEKGAAYQEQTSNLENVVDYLESAQTSLEDVTSHFDEA